jgi:isopentenyl-diphosphate delta-isomerase
MYFTPMSEVILVNSNDEEIGSMEKLEAHQKGILHRAFSVFIFNNKHKLLLQKRALDKYHSGGLWTNTCCSHPSPGEEILAAAKRRLIEEMGICAPLEIISSFIYKAAFENGLIEHEFDHILIGRYNDEVEINPMEVMDYKWISITDLNKEVSRHPDEFTIWFLKIYKQVFEQYLKR